jgi:hypothetical protein
MKVALFLMIIGILLLLLGGIPAVFEFMGIQGFPLDPTSSLFPSHWFLMIYGFFGALIGNEVLVALSVEWTGRTADNKLIILFIIFTLIGSISFIYNQQLGLVLILVAMSILLYYSKEYLGRSRIGLNPTLYNWLLFLSLMVTVTIIDVQISLGYVIPYLNLIFPVSMVFAVMARDISLVTGVKPTKGWEISLALVLLILGMTFRLDFLMILAWILSFHTSGIYKFKGRKYPIIHLFTAWLYLLIGSIFVFNYDIFIHSIAVGFLFNTVFGVDVVLMDLFINTFQKRVSIKPSYAPYFLLNLGLLMRFIYDLGLSLPFFLLSAPLQGIGILLFFILTLRQVIK